MVKNRRFSKSGMLQLFLVCVFPIHFWSILVQLRELNDITFWEIIGRGGYALLFALFESFSLFLMVALLSLMLPRQWGEKKTMTTIGALYLVVMVWAMLAQVYFMLDKSEGTFWFRGFNFVARHEGPFFMLMFASVLFSVLLPLFVLARSNKAADKVHTLMGRIMVLSGFYLLLDLAGIVVILIRNLQG